MGAYGDEIFWGSVMKTLELQEFARLHQLKVIGEKKAAKLAQRLGRQAQT